MWHSLLVCVLQYCWHYYVSRTKIKEGYHTFHATGSAVPLRDDMSTRVEALFFHGTDRPRAWKLWFFTWRTFHACGRSGNSLDALSTLVEGPSSRGTVYPRLWTIFKTAETASFCCWMSHYSPKKWGEAEFNLNSASPHFSFLPPSLPQPPPFIHLPTNYFLVYFRFRASWYPIPKRSNKPIGSNTFTTCHIVFSSLDSCLFSNRSFKVRFRSCIQPSLSVR